MGIEQKLKKMLMFIAVAPKKSLRRLVSQTGVCCSGRLQNVEKLDLNP